MNGWRTRSYTFSLSVFGITTKHSMQSRMVVRRKKILIRLIVKIVNYFWETSISSTLMKTIIKSGRREMFNEYTTIMNRFGTYHFIYIYIYIYIYTRIYIFIEGLIIFSFPHRWLCMKRIKIVGTTSVYFVFPHDVYFWTLSVKVH